MVDSESKQPEDLARQHSEPKQPEDLTGEHFYFRNLAIELEMMVAGMGESDRSKIASELAASIASKKS